jgi:hypothetical protein
MEDVQDSRQFIWIIDAAEVMVHVNDDWLAFARENDAPQLTEAMVLGQPIWRFIEGPENVYLFQQIFGRLRAGKGPVTFPFRCDSPDCRRFMEMKLTLLPENGILFQARMLRQEYRRPLHFIGPAPDAVTMCSWCKKVYIPGHGWGEIEAAIQALDLFGRPQTPLFTHGLCPSCADVVNQEMIRASAPDKDSP